jgi:hypothetical protein
MRPAAASAVPLGTPSRHGAKLRSLSIWLHEKALEHDERVAQLIFPLT